MSETEQLSGPAYRVYEYRRMVKVQVIAFDDHDAATKGEDLLAHMRQLARQNHVYDYDINRL